MDFNTKKFYKRLVTATFTLALQYIMLLSDNLIIGNLVGQEAVSAMSFVSPIATVLTYTCLISSVGAIICRTRELGNFNKKRADEYFSAGAIVAILAGLVLCALTFFGRDFYISFFNASGTVTQYAKEYFKFYTFLILVSPINMYLSNAIMVEGNVSLCNVSFIAQLIGNIIFSYIFTLKIGVAGASLGSLITMLLNIGVLATHFFRNDNQLKFVWHLSLKEILEFIKISTPNSFYNILWSIQFIVFNKFTISFYGSKYLPAITVLINIIQITSLFKGSEIALRSFVEIYLSEKNVSGMNILMKTVNKVVLIESIIVAGVCLLLSGPITRLFGVTDVDIINTSRVCISIIAFTMTIHAFEYTYSSYYLMIRKYTLSWIVTILCQFLAPVIAILVGIAIKSVGVPSLCIGLVVGLVVSATIFVIYLLKKYGKKKIPLLLDNSLKDGQLLQTFYLKTDDIFKALDNIEAFLIKKDVSKKIRNRVRLIAEETCMEIYEKNGKKPILTELVIDTNSEIRLLIRDDGVIFDMNDPNINIESFRDFVFNSLLEYHNERYHIVNAGYNRNAFVFH